MQYIHTIIQSLRGDVVGLCDDVVGWMQLDVMMQLDVVGCSLMQLDIMMWLDVMIQFDVVGCDDVVGWMDLLMDVMMQLDGCSWM